MPSRACIICGHPAVRGRSRCNTHGRSSPQGPPRHNSQHTKLARQVVREAIATGTYCAICGDPPSPTDPLEGGHIVPASQGGKNIKANYRAEHRSHNRAEGARLGRQQRAFRFSPER